MNRTLPIVLQAFICVFVVLFLESPGTPLGLILKGFTGLCVLILLKVAYNKMVFPGTLLGTVFCGLAWWFAPGWPMYLFIVLFLGNLLVTCKTAEVFYNRPG